MICPLCANSEKKDIILESPRTFYRCPSCDLIFLDKKFYLTPEEEKKRYELHQNNPNDKGYIEFLSQLVNPLLPHLKPYSKGLDFGCGPHPTLSKLFEAHGHQVEDYDPYFLKEKTLLTQKYDFITTTEVVEHLAHPLQELKKVWSLLPPQGLLGIMTLLTDNIADFKTWWYKNDPTHICFFSKKTITWLTKKLNAETILIQDRVIILKKNSPISSNENPLKG